MCARMHLSLHSPSKHACMHACRHTRNDGGLQEYGREVGSGVDPKPPMMPERGGGRTGLPRRMSPTYGPYSVACSMMRRKMVPGIISRSDMYLGMSVISRVSSPPAARPHEACCGLYTESEPAIYCRVLEGPVLQSSPDRTASCEGHASLPLSLSSHSSQLLPFLPLSPLTIPVCGKWLVL